MLVLKSLCDLYMKERVTRTNQSQTFLLFLGKQTPLLGYEIQGDAYAFFLTRQPLEMRKEKDNFLFQICMSLTVALFKALAFVLHLGDSESRQTWTTFRWLPDLPKASSLTTAEPLGSFFVCFAIQSRCLLSFSSLTLAHLCFA